MQDQAAPAPQVDQNLKKTCLMVYSAQIYSASARATRLRHMPLDLDNGLPAIKLHFGLCIDDKISFLCHMDTCAAMNTGNVLVHQWIMTKDPYIVCIYEQYNDENPFDPLSLSCAVTMDNVSAMYGKLTAVVTYHTQYTDTDGTPITLAFGLGASVAVNAIVGLPTIRKWKACIDVGQDIVNSKLMNLIFPIHYRSAVRDYLIIQLSRAPNFADHGQLQSVAAHTQFLAMISPMICCIQQLHQLILMYQNVTLQMTLHTNRFALQNDPQINSLVLTSSFITLTIPQIPHAAQYA